MRIRKALFKRSGPLLQWWAKHYFTKARKYKHHGISGVILPGVFFPHLTWSTSILMDHLAREDLRGKTFLELGCGSGFISVLAAKKGAKVTASDIYVKAIENAQLNAKSNAVDIKFIQSDLFDEIPKQPFDFIVINPPYYPKNPTTDEEKAWYCGKDFQYFQKLFSQIQSYFGSHSKVILILSEDCEIDRIKGIARENKLEFNQFKKVKNWAEENFLFHLEGI